MHFYSKMHFTIASVAQWIEHISPEDEAVGSTPIRRTKNTSCYIF